MPQWTKPTDNPSYEDDIKDVQRYTAGSLHSISLQDVVMAALCRLFVPKL